MLEIPKVISEIMAAHVSRVAGIFFRSQEHGGVHKCLDQHAREVCDGSRWVIPEGARESTDLEKSTNARYAAWITSVAVPAPPKPVRAFIDPELR